MSIITTMPNKLSMSAMLCTMSSKVSVSCSTSLWLRDMILPTGVRWKKEGDRSCRWLNIWVRKVNRMLWASLGMNTYWTYIALKYTKVTPRKIPARILSFPLSPSLMAHSIPSSMNRGTDTLPMV